MGNVGIAAAAQRNATSRTMRMSNIDTQLLRSLVTIVDASGFARAAEMLHMTQPAISQQMRRLEDMVGQTLFQRDGRIMRLNEHGEVLLGYARRIIALNDEAVGRLNDMKRTRATVTLGIPEHFLDAFLHRIIARVAHHSPDIRLVVRTGTSQRLAAGMAQGEIDLALILNELGSSPTVLQTIPVNWVCGNGFEPDPAAVVPLVVYSGQCLFRRLITTTLEAINRTWSIAYESDDLASLRAAVRANLGITALPDQQLPPDMQHLTGVQTLPQLPASELSLQFCLARTTTPVREVGDLIQDMWSTAVS